MRTRVRSIEGNTIVEVLIAMLLVALAAAALSPLLLTPQAAGINDSVRQEMVLATTKLKETLKNYNTPTTAITSGAPGTPAWHLPQDSSCGACWALEAGLHDVSSMLPARLRSDFNATLTYTVTLVPNPFNGTPLRKLRIDAQWDRSNG